MPEQELVALHWLPPFGDNNASGAFTRTEASFNGHVFIVTLVNNDETIHCYNLKERSFQDLAPDLSVKPMTEFNLVFMRNGEMISVIGNRAV